MAGDNNDNDAYDEEDGTMEIQVENFWCRLEWILINRLTEFSDCNTATWDEIGCAAI